MEVHHHPQVENKRFKEYFLEFLMIFLAVTMGFFAESLRESLSDHSREREYMKSLVEDLASDTAQLKQNARRWHVFISNDDSLRKYLRPSSHKFDTKQCYKYAASIYEFTEFHYSDRTIEELRNSGNFRLVENSKIVDSL